MRGKNRRENLSLMIFDKNDNFSAELTDEKWKNFQWKEKATYHVSFGEAFVMMSAEREKKEKTLTTFRLCCKFAILLIQWKSDMRFWLK